MQTGAGKEHWQTLEELSMPRWTSILPSVESFLDRSCLNNPALRSEIELLVNSADKTWGFFQKPWQAAAQSVAPSANRGGQRIGDYEVIRLIGVGGMSEVYLARRADDLYEQKVAIKVVQSGTG